MSRGELDFPGATLRAPARRRALFAARDAAVVALAAPAWAAAAQAAAAPPVVHAMHGFADRQGFTLWLQGRVAQTVRVDTWLADAPSADPLRSQTVSLDPATDATAHVRIVDLEPGTAYRYSVLDASGNALAAGNFRTPPLWEHRTDPPPLRIALGSCAYLNDGRFDRPGTPYGGGEEIFDSIAAARPDLMLWLGDNIYLREPEWTSREGINRRHRYYREHASLRKLFTATSHIAIWDDHDFGPNDADASFVNGAWTREMFQRYWPMPYPTTSGDLHGMVNIGDVDIFMLDDRSYRYPVRWQDSKERVLYGAAQVNWLQRALVASTARFKLVAGGSQFFNRANNKECWTQFPAEEQAMRRWMEVQKVPGVVFLSGDRHFAELLRIERPGTYPLIELTTSPLTSSPVRKPGAAETSNPDLVPGTLYTDRNFALLSVTGPRNDRTLVIELKDTQGRKVWDWQVKASALV